MTDYLNDPETQKRFAEIREANESARLAEEERLARVKAEASRIAQERAEERKRQATARLDADLRTAFFAANPGATESDWQRLAPQIRDAHMLAAASQASINVFDRVRSDAQKRQQDALDRQDRFNRLPQGA